MFGEDECVISEKVSNYQEVRKFEEKGKCSILYTLRFRDFKNFEIVYQKISDLTNIKSQYEIHQKVSKLYVVMPVYRTLRVFSIHFDVCVIFTEFRQKKSLYIFYSDTLKCMYREY